MGIQGRISLFKQTIIDKGNIQINEIKKLPQYKFNMLGFTESSSNLNLTNSLFKSDQTGIFIFLLNKIMTQG